jgi:hypothetical protein
MRHAPNQVSLEGTRDAFLSADSPWLPLVDRIKEFFPQLQVWRYEDYRGNEEAYISALAGTQVTVPEIADPAETLRLPAETIAALERLRATGREVPEAGTWEPPVNPTRFEMFSDIERDELTRAYARDVEALASRGILFQAGSIAPRAARTHTPDRYC